MISAVIPAFNEESVLEETTSALERVLARLSPSAWEIVIVDDGSTDGTPEITRRLEAKSRFHIIRHKTNRGKGAAVRTGVLQTKGDFVAVVDADNSTSPEQLEQFLAELARGADVVTGDRRSPGAQIVRPQSLLRRVMGGGYAALARRITGTSLRDFNCGFKVLRGAAARTLLAECGSDRWAWDVEIVAWAVLHGWSVRAIPVTWQQGTRSSVRPFRATLGTAAELASLWVRLPRCRKGVR